MRIVTLSYLAIILSICLQAGCTSNVFSVRTSPSAATVKIYAKGGMIHEGVSDITDFEINDKNKKQVYGDSKDSELGIAIEKQGYRSVFFFLPLNQDKKDPGLKKISLEALDTDIQVDVDPPGAKASFYESKSVAKKARGEGRVSIPLGESFGGNGSPDNVDAYKEFAEFYSKYNSQIKHRTDSSVTLPWKQSYTSSTARSAFNNVRAIRIEAEDYLPIIEEFTIEPGKNNTKLFQLKKMNTVLKVLSDIEGVEIEDTDNFGYIGKTPLVRQLSYKECTRDEKFSEDSKVTMTLRAYKAGYIDQKVPVAIPWGEESTVKVSLKPRTSQITFQSDPEGVHVYVKRDKKETQFVKNDDGKSEWQEKKIYIEKHLGTTPFTYTMDASDPLEHNDSLVYKKPGYVDPDEKDSNKNRFAIGINSYHKVMVPAAVKER
jgi:hypothetical protein